MDLNSSSLETSCDKTTAHSKPSSTSSKAGILSSRQMIKINYAEGAVASTKLGKFKKNSYSPYLTEDVHLISHITEKTLLQKKAPKFMSSFPLAVNIYKANSDEFKTLKKNKKIKKSVLTLPNNPAPKPQTCTVSDLNDCEYLNSSDDLRQFSKTKKRQTVRASKNRRKTNNFEFYDRDAHYCSQLNIDLDCSSTEIISNLQRGGKKTAVKTKTDENVDPHDVWAVLRNINRFQFQPSPPTSDEISTVSPGKWKCPKRRNNRKDMRVIERCCTEEFAVISNYEVETRSLGSQSSSFDRITVIGRDHCVDNTCKQVEKTKTRKPSKLGAKNKNQVNKTNKKNAIHAKSNKETRHTKKIRQNKQGGDVGEITYYNSNAAPTPNLSADSPIVYVNENIINCELNPELHDSDLISASNRALDVETNENKSDIVNVCQTMSMESRSELLGITKVILNNAKKIDPNVAVVPKIKPKAPPSIVNPVPKLTKFDIRRRLANLTYPIVILGKDQLSCNYELKKQDFIQFQGLDSHIWPFMSDWYANVNPKRTGITQKSENTSNGKTYEINTTKKNLSPKILSNEPRQPSPIKDKNINRDIKVIDKQKRLPPHELEKEVLSEKNNMSMFKDKMLRLLYKSSNHKDNRIAGIKKENTDRKTIHKVDVGTTTSKINSCITKKCLSPVKLKNIVSSPPLLGQRYKHKSKWASDLIENVIKKIKNGVYYTLDSNTVTKKASVPHLKEIETQTNMIDDINKKDSMQSITKVVLKKKCDPYVIIPGFEVDNVLPKFEIKSMTLNEISVKTCNNNILVRFDVNIPTEPSVNHKRSSSLIPVDISESHTKVFKCKTIIKNSMLPAEICSILPKLMNSLIDTKGQLALPSTTMEKFGFHLTTIQEGSPVSSNSSINIYIENSSEIRRLLNGHFYDTKLYRLVNGSNILPAIKTYAINDVLPYLERKHLFNIDALFHSFINTRNTSIQQTTVNSVNTCRALQVYRVSERCLVPAYKRFNIFDIVQNMSINSVSETQTLESPIIVINPLTVKLFLSDCQYVTSNITIEMDKISETSREKLWLIAKFFDKTNIILDKNGYAPVKRNCEIIPQQEPLNVKTKINVSKKIKSLNFKKLYRKCKSSHIPKENRGVPISKITHLDDFFELLGTMKFSGVFDGFSGHKILTSVGEMKKWTSHITPKQALLVLLLMNKKDTPNLLLFRSVLLQGIAMNRITRSNELDMEIEVIEREYNSKVSRYEGISYLPASLENQDILLEELIWIAKNTASDYQVPFDETSENLLKSLVEKRKKLNPSYLRVMARYVGLGLLKLPKKH